MDGDVMNNIPYRQIGYLSKELVTKESKYFVKIGP